MEEYSRLSVHHQIISFKSIPLLIWELETDGQRKRKLPSVDSFTAHYKIVGAGLCWSRELGSHVDLTIAELKFQGLL